METLLESYQQCINKSPALLDSEPILNKMKVIIKFIMYKSAVLWAITLMAIKGHLFVQIVKCTSYKCR